MLPWHKKVCGGGCALIKRFRKVREQNMFPMFSFNFFLLKYYPARIARRLPNAPLRLCHEIISRTPAKLSLHVGFCYPYPPRPLKHDRPLFEYFIRQSHGFQKMRGEEKQMVPRHIMTYQ